MRSRHTPVLTVGALLLAAALPATAQQGQPMPHGGMGMHGPAMQSAMQRMQGAMASSGDPDVDFARMMIPHHQGAIDMAKSELEHGRSEEMRRLARKIVEDQQKEIEQLQAFLAKAGKP